MAISGNNVFMRGEWSVGHIQSRWPSRTSRSSWWTARLAIAEYRHQFQAKRKRKAPCTEDGLVPLARAGSREAAFFSALTAAGVVHAVARACNTSEVIRQNCTWTYQPWLLPGDNVKYGRHFAKLFLDAGVKDRWRQGGRRKSLSKFLLMELHNNEAGRRAVEDLSYFKCGCAERTGECVGVCLPRLQDFRSVGDFLKEKYNVSSAMRLVRSNSSSSDVARWRLQPVNEWLPAPGASELVHVEAREYCVRGAPGGAPARRRCNDTSEANERCSDINAACCDTGYDISQDANSIRHTLSLHSRFVRVQNEGPGKSSWWTYTGGPGPPDDLDAWTQFRTRASSDASTLSTLSAGGVGGPSPRRPPAAMRDSSDLDDDYDDYDDDGDFGVGGSLLPDLSAVDHHHHRHHRRLDDEEEEGGGGGRCDDADDDEEAMVTSGCAEQAMGFGGSRAEVADHHHRRHRHHHDDDDQHGLGFGLNEAMMDELLDSLSLSLQQQQQQQQNSALAAASPPPPPSSSSLAAAMLMLDGDDEPRMNKAMLTHADPLMSQATPNLGRHLHLHHHQQQLHHHHQQQQQQQRQQQQQLLLLHKQQQRMAELAASASSLPTATSHLGNSLSSPSLPQGSHGPLLLVAAQRDAGFLQQQQQLNHHQQQQPQQQQQPRFPCDLDVEMFNGSLDCDVDSIIHSELLLDGAGFEFSFDSAPSPDGSSLAGGSGGAHKNWLSG
ncbi:forkhead box protein O3-like [Lethenteron reissneri]|uniref:forkhead box protein O3-like n=1 Tax=Lethenteron reissneri TaxID=7753 RepID=UPI002AB614D4|nr:forkhead box protein O3-like [Lethenteron reissneri]